VRVQVERGRKEKEGGKTKGGVMFFEYAEKRGRVVGRKKQRSPFMGKLLMD